MWAARIKKYAAMFNAHSFVNRWHFPAELSFENEIVSSANSKYRRQHSKFKKSEAVHPEKLSAALLPYDIMWVE